MAPAEQQQLALPVEVVSRVLQHVPQQHRLTSCALVSREWHMAAIAATTHATASFKSAPPSAYDSDPLGRSMRLKSLGVWLLKHGGVVESMLVERHPEIVQKHDFMLPFHQLTKLRTLKLQCVFLNKQAGGSEHDAAGSWGELTALVRLDLEGVIVGAAAGIDSLAALAGLRRLLLKGHQMEMPRDNGRYVGCYHGEMAGDLTSRVVRKLTGLTFLRMEGQNMGQSTVAAVGALPELRHLYLKDYEGLKAPDIIDFPTSLTRLILSNTKDVKLDPENTNLGHISGLVALHIASKQNTDIDPGLFAKLTGLTWLGLIRCDLSGKGADALLQALPPLSQLKHLDLKGTITNHPDQSSHLSALVSSSGLTNLCLLDCALPTGSIRQVVPMGQQLTSLLTLTLGWGSLNPTDNVLLGPGDIDHLAVCCPSLQRLMLHAAVQPGVQATLLAQLASLTALEVSGQVIDDNWVKGTLLKLTNLDTLKLGNSDQLTIAGMIQLQQLTQLTRLKLERVFRELCLQGPAGPILTDFKSEVDPPDVYVQLQDWCFHMKTSAKVMWQAKAAELEEMKVHAANLEQKLQQEKQHAADLQEQLAALRLEVQQMKAVVGSGTPIRE